MISHPNNPPVTKPLLLGRWGGFRRHEVTRQSFPDFGPHFYPTRNRRVFVEVGGFVSGNSRPVQARQNGSLGAAAIPPPIRIGNHDYWSGASVAHLFRPNGPHIRCGCGESPGNERATRHPSHPHWKVIYINMPSMSVVFELATAELEPCLRIGACI